MSTLYPRIRDLYMSGSIDETGLTNAVAKGWITEEEKQQLIEEKNNTATGQ